MDLVRGGLTMRSDLLSDDDHARVRWSEDAWDVPDEVPVVEVAPRRAPIARWFMWGVLWAVVAGIIAAGATGWWLLERMTPEADAGAPVDQREVTVPRQESHIGPSLRRISAKADTSVAK